VKNETEMLTENILYAIQCIEDVAIERQNTEAHLECLKLQSIVSNLNTIPLSNRVEQFKEIRSTANRIASDLLAAIKFELREVLIPFIEVKRATHEFGAKTFPDFFRWLSPEKQYTPELLVGILEEQTRKLFIALQHLQKS